MTHHAHITQRAFNDACNIVRECIDETHDIVCDDELRAIMRDAFNVAHVTIDDDTYVSIDRDAR